MAVAPAHGLSACRNEVPNKFERFAAEMVETRRRGHGGEAAAHRQSATGGATRHGGERMYERALESIDREGLDAVTARRLAADLRIYTQTLYKRVGTVPK
jgi:hypothetical protein